MRWQLVALGGITATICGLVVGWVHSRLASFMAGVSAASVVWLVALLVIEVTGSSSWRMGAVAEDWTGEELAKLDSRRWRVVHAVGLEYGDVDHVVLGPPGVMALETKWSSTGWGPQEFRPGGRVSIAVEQAKRSAKGTRSRLASYFRRTPVTPVVVLWGEVVGVELPLVVGEGTVVHGADLREWLLRERPEQLSSEEVVAASRGLEEYVALRDSGETRAFAPSRFVDVGASGVAGDVASGVGGGVGGFLVGLGGFTVPVPLAARLVIAAIPLALGVGLRRAQRPRWRLAGLGAAVGGGAVFLTLAAAYALAFLLS